MSKRDPGLSWMRCFYNVQQGSVAPCGWHYIGLGQMNMFVIFHWDTRWCSTSTAFISLSVSWLVYCFHSRAWTWYHRHHCYSCLSFCTHKRSVLFNSLLTTNSFPLSLCVCVCVWPLVIWFRGLISCVRSWGWWRAAGLRMFERWEVIGSDREPNNRKRRLSHKTWFIFTLGIFPHNTVIVIVQTVARRLAEVLLSSVSEESYWGPLSPSPPTWLHKDGATHPKDAIYPSSRPPQYYSTEGWDSYTHSYTCIELEH